MDFSGLVEIIVEAGPQFAIAIILVIIYSKAVNRWMDQVETIFRDGTKEHAEILEALRRLNGK